MTGRAIALENVVCEEQQKQETEPPRWVTLLKCLEGCYAEKGRATGIEALDVECQPISCPGSVGNTLQPSLRSTRHIFQKTFPSSRPAGILSHSPRAALHRASVSDRYHGVAAPGCGWTETGLHCRGISNWGRKEKDPIQVRERLGSKWATLKSRGSPKTHLPIFTACLAACSALCNLAKF